VIDRLIEQCVTEIDWHWYRVCLWHPQVWSFRCAEWRYRAWYKCRRACLCVCPSHAASVSKLVTVGYYHAVFTTRPCCWS